MVGESRSATPTCNDSSVVPGAQVPSLDVSITPTSKHHHPIGSTFLLIQNPHTSPHFPPIAHSNQCGRLCPGSLLHSTTPHRLFLPQQPGGTCEHLNQVTSLCLESCVFHRPQSSSASRSPQGLACPDPSPPPHSFQLTVPVNISIPGTQACSHVPQTPGSLHPQGLSACCSLRFQLSSSPFSSSMPHLKYPPGPFPSVLGPPPLAPFLSFRALLSVMK